MIMKFEGLNRWRNFFCGAEANIFDIIDNAILVAATDNPDEFKFRTPMIVENVYSCQLCCSHNLLHEPGTSKTASNDSPLEECKNGCVKSRSNSGSNLGNEEGKQNHTCGSVNINPTSIASHSEDEALTAAADDEEITQEVYRIKEILSNSRKQSEEVLRESLRRLQFMDISFEILQRTQIGRTVNSLRKHKSRQITQLVASLVEGWKKQVDEWLEAREAVADLERSMDSNPSDLENEDFRLGFPLLDEEAILAATELPMELSEFFDGMDDEGNLQESAETRKIFKAEEKSHLENNIFVEKPHVSKKTSEHRGSEEEFMGQSNKPSKVKTLDSKNDAGKFQKQSQKPKINNEIDFKKVGVSRNDGVQLKRKVMSGKKQEDYQVKKEHVEEASLQEAKNSSKPINTNLSKINSASSRHQVQKVEEKINCQVDIHKNPGEAKTCIRPLVGQQCKFRQLDEDLVQAKLEATRRKLKEGYQQVEQVKKQRTTQFMHPHDLPKQGPGRQKFQPKQKHYRRQGEFHRF